MLVPLCTHAGGDAELLMSQAITDRVASAKDGAGLSPSVERSSVEQGSAKPNLAAEQNALGFGQANASVGTAGDCTASDSCPVSDNALNVLRARYLIKGEDGQCTESPADLFRRVAKTVSGPEMLYNRDSRNRSEWEDRFYSLMASGKFMPNSPTLMNAGREMGMLSACFVLPVRDSINEIFDSIKHTALIQKAGGGTGFAFDELRPTGDFIKSSGGRTSGPISFWRAFSEATNAIQQGAFRRGANMGMMYIDHPDILKFLHAKENLNQFTNYNISVKVTDAWMEAYRAAPDAPHVVRNPRTDKTYYLPKGAKIWEYDLTSLPSTESVSGEKVSGEEFYTRRDIWDIIVKNAWKTGEPGVIYIDRINNDNPTPHVGRMEATNPCGEQPLLPYEACNLGSVNVARFVDNPCTPQAKVNWSSLRTTIHESTRFLDNVIDANNYPLPEIDAICKGNRKIGLGVMGFADALFKLGVRYDSDEGVEWGERFMKFLNDEAHAYSEKLARQRGCFPNWKGSTWETKHQRPMRNACSTTVAPTGTISIIADCSCGIEPLFSLVFYRNVLKGQAEGRVPMIEVSKIFKSVIQERGLFNSDVLDKIAKEGTLAHISEMPEDLKHVFVCAHDIKPEWHVKMQAAFQRHCDASISKTINFPESASVEDVETIYRLSYDLDCKGVTVYRDGCRNSQPMALKDSGKKKEDVKAEAAKTQEKSTNGTNGSSTPVVDSSLSGAKVDETVEQALKVPYQKPVEHPRMEPRTLPEILSSVRIRQMTPFGNMHVQITVDPKTEHEMEVFAQLGKGGDLANSDLEAICRMVSLWLRAGGNLRHVVQQLKGIGSSLQVSTKEGKIMSLGDGLARALTKYQRAKTHFGLHRLLLGQFDLEELDRVRRGLATTPAAKPVPKQSKGSNPANRINGLNGGGSTESKHGDSALANDIHNQDTPTVVATAPMTVATGPMKVAAQVVQTANPISEVRTQQEQFKVLCPECQGPLNYTEGCCMCHGCGYAQC